MAGDGAASMTGPKWVVLGVWLLGALAFLGPLELAVVRIGRSIFWTLVVVHAIECVVFLPRLRRAPGSLAGHLGQTFVFGILHARALPRSPDAGGGAVGD